MVDHCPGRVLRDQAVDEFIETVLSAVDMNEVLDRTGVLLRKHYGSTRVGVHLCLDGRPDEAEVLLVDDPVHPTPAPGTRFSLAGSISGEAIRTGEPVVLDHLDRDNPRFLEEAVLGDLGYGAVACFPLMVEQRAIGALEIAHQPACGLLCSCVRTAEKIAKLIAIALQNSLLVQEVRRLNEALNRENQYLKQEIETTRGATGYVAQSRVMRAVLADVRQAAPQDATVLLRGETGTGKEGLARILHEASPRSAGPFVVVNVGAVPENLIESELFGHERGAFTGASARRIGRFEQADGGTLFLDEIGDAPLPLQVKLLRALQEREIQRVGGDRSIPVDVRVVAATHRRLEQMIAEGTFREDLYYRLAIVPIQLPPLRERRGDVRPLVEHLVRRHAARMNRRPPLVPEAVLAALEAYIWPGNVRELENYLERALIFSPGPTLILPEAPGAPDRWRGTPVDQPAPERPPGRFEDEVRALLERTLTRTGGKIYGKDGAATLLGLRPTTLQGKLRRYGLKETPAGRPQDPM